LLNWCPKIPTQIRRNIYKKMSGKNFTVSLTEGSFTEGIYRNLETEETFKNRQDNVF
jgi:hypothetical protein